MSNISEERLKNVLSCVDLMGKSKAAENFDLSLETMNRYIREGRNRGVVLEEDVAERKPNILIFDIENTYTKAGIWNVWNFNTPMDMITSPWFMLSWAAKWLFDDEVISDVVTPEEAVNEDDKRIVGSLWKMIDAADIIIGHNIKKFDVKKMNTRYLLHGMVPPSPYQQVDTLEVARKHFAIEHNKLDYIARMLGIEGKMENGGAETWVKCTQGDAESLKTMDKYNKQDVNVTEEVYVKLRPWFRSHPNLAMHYDDMHTRCPNCGSTELKYDTGKFYYTPLNKYSAVRCLNCGAVGRARHSALTKEKSQSMITTTAR